MATRSIHKQQVLAQCVGIMRRQLRCTRHPRLKNLLEEAIGHFEVDPDAGAYGMIVYTNAIRLVHDDYRDNLNLELYPDGRLYIGRYDEWLKLNDENCIRIHGDGKADCGRSRHGFLTGECITETIEYRQGKEVRHQYDTKEPPAYLAEGAVVDNDPSLDFFGRLRRNSTIGRGDFVLGLMLLYLLFQLAIGAGAMLWLGADGAAGGILAVGGGLLLFAAYVMLLWKRIGDLAIFGAARVLAVLVVLGLPILLLAAVLMKGRVLGRAEQKEVEAKQQELYKKARQALACRCDTSELVPDWFKGVAARTNFPMSPFGGEEGMPVPESEAPQSDESDDERIRQAKEAEEAAAKERAREAKRADLDRDISHLRTCLSSARSRYNQEISARDRAKMQADSYLSYANSASEESLRTDYLQKAENFLSDVSSAESAASSVQSEINELERRISSLESERSSV